VAQPFDERSKKPGKIPLYDKPQEILKHLPDFFNNTLTIMGSAIGFA
jgi:hypothetical protein